MKVLLINGSPKAKGCTYTALCEVAKALENEGIETEIFHVGNKPIRGCTSCGGCSNTDGMCVFNDDPRQEYGLAFKMYTSRKGSWNYIS